MDRSPWALQGRTLQGEDSKSIFAYNVANYYENYWFATSGANKYPVEYIKRASAPIKPFANLVNLGRKSAFGRQRCYILSRQHLVWKSFQRVMSHGAILLGAKD